MSMTRKSVVISRPAADAYMSACVDEVASWMSSNRLQLNAHKTEMLWCATARRQSQLPTSTFRVCTDYVTPSTAVRDVSMRSQVSQTVSNSFGILRQLRSIRRSVSHSVFQSLVAALVPTKQRLWKRYAVRRSVVPTGPSAVNCTQPGLHAVELDHVFSKNR